MKVRAPLRGLDHRRHVAWHCRVRHFALSKALTPCQASAKGVSHLRAHDHPTLQTRHVMTENENTRVRMQDVARHSGVSVATVSRALSGATGMSPATRKRVLAVASALSFRHNEIARSLKSRFSRTIGFLTDDIEGVFTMLILRGLEDLATTMGFNVFLCNSYDDPQRERDHLEALMAKQVDGLVLSSGYRVRERVRPAAPTGSTPFVYVYQYTNEVAAHCVIPDDLGGGNIAATHLVEVGRRRIGVIAGPKHYDASALRLRGARQALRHYGLSLPSHRVRQGLKWHEDVGYELARSLMEQDPPPDALFCMSDNLAVGALDAVRELGFNVPSDVSLIGFDDRYRAAHTRPPLTTVALPLYEIGRFAGHLLIDQVTGKAPPPEAPTLHRLPCNLVERSSSRPSLLAAPGPEPLPFTGLRASPKQVSRGRTSKSQHVQQPSSIGGSHKQ